VVIADSKPSQVELEEVEILASDMWKEPSLYSSEKEESDANDAKENVSTAAPLDAEGKVNVISSLTLSNDG